MSLWLITEKEKCLAYNPWDGSLPWFPYNPWLVAPPRLYDENINRLECFFYVPGNDYLVCFLWTNQLHWPSWGHKRAIWHAGTGELVSFKDAGSLASAYSHYPCLGSFGQIYSTYVSNYDVYSLDWMTLNKQTLAWTSPQGISYALINSEDDKVVGLSSYLVNIFQKATKVILGSLRFPKAPNCLSWESRRFAWAMTSSGSIFKIAYGALPPRFELMSSVQNPDPSALDYRLAFDTLRNRIAVLRWLPDSADGSCNLKLEFYRPMVKVSSTGLTDPVPLAPIRAGQATRFLAHLHGDMGEGLAAYNVNAGIAAPAVGKALAPAAPTLVNGEAVFGYQAPAGSAGEHDTLVITARLLQDGS